METCKGRGDRAITMHAHVAGVWRVVAVAGGGSRIIRIMGITICLCVVSVLVGWIRFGMVMTRGILHASSVSLCVWPGENAMFNGFRASQVGLLYGYIWAWAWQAFFQPFCCHAFISTRPSISLAPGTMPSPTVAS